MQVLFAVHHWGKIREPSLIPRQLVSSASPAAARRSSAQYLRPDLRHAERLLPEQCAYTIECSRV